MKTHGRIRGRCTSAYVVRQIAATRQHTFNSFYLLNLLSKEACVRRNIDRPRCHTKTAEEISSNEEGRLPISLSAAEFGDLLSTTPYLAALDRRRHHRRRPDQAKPTSSSSSIAPIARAPWSPRTGISLKWKSTAPPATSPSNRAASCRCTDQADRAGRAAARRPSQNAPRRIPRRPPAKG